MGTIEGLQQVVEQVMMATSPSVVRIGRGPGRGAGFVLGQGLVLTNAHNLRGQEVTTTFADGRAETGSVAGVDVDGDLAVLRAGTGSAPALPWHEGVVKIGAPVFAVTTPTGANARITFGTISAVGRLFRGPRGRLISDGLEHTAPLARGSSGSPIVDNAGRLLGINTHRLGEGFYLAMPAGAELRERVDALARGESPRRPYLGVALLPRSAARRLRASVGLPARDGVLVKAVDGSGPAAHAGVLGGDLLVEAGGAALKTPDDLFDILRDLGDGEELELRVVRGTDELTVRVRFEEP